MGRSVPTKPLSSVVYARFTGGGGSVALPPRRFSRVIAIISFPPLLSPGGPDRPRSDMRHGGGRGRVVSRIWTSSKGKGEGRRGKGDLAN